MDHPGERAVGDPGETAGGGVLSREFVVMATRQQAASVTVYPGGPYLVRGAVSIVDQDQTMLERQGTVALCACGRSRRKPLCDGSHKATRDWRDRTALGRAPAPDPAEGAEAG